MVLYAVIGVAAFITSALGIAAVVLMRRRRLFFKVRHTHGGEPSSLIVARSSRLLYIHGFRG